MEAPSSESLTTTADQFHMRLPTVPGLPQSQHPVPTGRMPEQWQPGVHPNQLPGLNWTGVHMCADNQSTSFPGSQFWGLASTPWRQEVPSTMPWAGQRPGMVSFTGVPPCSSPPDRVRPPTVTCKRRLQKGEEEPSSKHFLTEEMMADHFNCLSLENDHAYGAKGFPSREHPDGKWHQWLSDYTRFQDLEDRLHPDQMSPPLDGKATEEVLVEGECIMKDTPVLTVSPELQESLRGSSMDSILPEKVLHSMSHPCMELVLWKPPGNLIHEAIRCLTRQRDGSRDRDGCNGRTVPQRDVSQSLYASRASQSSVGGSSRRGVLQDSEDAMEL